ncbi:MAG: TIGR04338 family metallohydrolase [Marmoricola sp.]
MSRDIQRAKVYAAEDLVARILDHTGVVAAQIELHGSTLVLEQERRFGTLEAVQAYVTAVQGQPWYRQRYPNIAPLTVRHRRGNHAAHYDPAQHEIAVHYSERAGAAWSLREMIILHEMAHAATDGVSHDPRFAAEFIKHVRQVIGESVAFLLRDAMYQNGVQICPCSASDIM